MLYKSWVEVFKINFSNYKNDTIVNYKNFNYKKFKIQNSNYLKF